MAIPGAGTDGQALSDGVPTFTFAHLSDIHLAGYGEDAMFDVDSDLRSELQHDLEALVAAVAPLDAVILGGDIAGLGQPSEFKAATTWIQKLCATFDVSFEERVFCVPGNHDVTWDVIKSDPVVKIVQDALLNCRPDEFSALLERLLVSGPNRSLALSPLEAYNIFAAQFRCAFELTEHSWAQVLQFGHLRVRIVGLASAIISGPSDAQEPENSRLALGPQGLIHRYKDTFTIVVCHHPPGWFRDRANVEQYLERGHLQLYGHEHKLEIAEAGDGVRINAGAVHPPRAQDPWTPSYNLISLRVEDDDAPLVTVDVYPRRLRDGRKFGPTDDDEQMQRYRISVALDAGQASAPAVPAQEPPEVTSPDERRLAHRFVALSPDRRLVVGQELGLLDDADRRLPEGVQIRKIFDRARARQQLKALEDRINHG